MNAVASGSVSPRTIAVVTGTRAEFGLLRTTMRAIASRRELKLQVLVTGTHLLPPASTIEEIRAEFPIAATIPMQEPGHHGRLADAAALGRGISGFAAHLAHAQPAFVLVLGDRIEAFAAAATASVAGIRVAHMHGGDRAEGVADEAMRHAITKLAHIHLPATPTSADRIRSMGEEAQRVHLVGSPAIDGLREVPPLSDREYEVFQRPEIVVLLHPTGDSDEVEYERASNVLAMAQRSGRTLALHPNHDAGRAGIERAIAESGCPTCAHLPRSRFIGLMRRVKALVGNSSAGLIECAALPTRCVNLGRRQAGREMPGNVINIPAWDYRTIHEALLEAVSAAPLREEDVDHPYGDGRTGERVAAILAELDLAAHPLAKRNTY